VVILTAIFISIGRWGV